MKRFLAALAFLLLPCSAFATTTVMGALQNLGTGTVGTGSFVRFWLRGCSGNQPRINGTAIIAPSQGGVFFFDLIADGSGNISGTLYSTRDSTGLLGGDVECGGSKTAVWYGMQAFSAGKGGPEIPIHAKSGVTLDITQVVPISSTPVVTAPTGDSTYLRLDGTNGPISGYNSTLAAGSGLAVIAGEASKLTQSANVTAATLYTIPAGGVGWYRPTCYVVISRAASSTSTLPNCIISWTDNDTLVGEAVNLTVITTANVLGTNGQIANNVAAFYAKPSTTIQYSSANYASSGGTSLQYNLRIILEYLGP